MKKSNCIICNEEFNLIVHNKKTCSVKCVKLKNKQLKQRKQQENKEYIKNKKREYYLKNRESILEDRKLYQKKNANKIAKRKKQHRLDNLEKIKIKKKEYYKKNKEHILKNWLRNHDIRKVKDPLYKLTTTLRSTIRASFRKNGYTKRSRTYKILGCTFEELRTHLISTFEKNYKIEWKDEYEKHLHMDHIIPISSAETEEEVYKLNHYSNLQYLYSEDNLSKSDHVDWELDLTITKFYDIIKETEEENG